MRWVELGRSLGVDRRGHVPHPWSFVRSIKHNDKFIAKNWIPVLLLDGFGWTVPILRSLVAEFMHVLIASLSYFAVLHSWNKIFSRLWDGWSSAEAWWGAELKQCAKLLNLLKFANFCLLFLDPYRLSRKIQSFWRFRVLGACFRVWNSFSAPWNSLSAPWNYFSAPWN